jgi:predicted DNA-binding antitoxin AbrB/MazE fold protein
MSRQQFDAIYEGGVLKPLTPLNLPEHERVTLIVRGTDDEEDEIDSDDDMLLVAREGDPSITWEEVQRATTSIPGSLADEVIRQREERF